jgi:hypothetical protein
VTLVCVLLRGAGRWCECSCDDHFICVLCTLRTRNLTIDPYATPFPPALNAVLIAEDVATARHSVGPGSSLDDLQAVVPPLAGATPWEVHKFGGAALADAVLYRRW